jgi:mRNA interferase RelE/StbE
MTYKLQFLPVALREWKKLSVPIQKQFKKKLIERLKNPHIPGSRLSGAQNLYKIRVILF